MDTAQIDGMLRRLHQRSRADAERLALLAIQALAQHLQAATPPGTQVYLAQRQGENFQQVASFGPPGRAAELRPHVEEFAVAANCYCRFLTEDTRDTWLPFTAEQDVTSIEYWGQRMLLTDLAVTAATGTPCGCPPGATLTTADRIRIIGHQGQCRRAVPRQYVWLDENGRPVVGDLAAYGRDYELANDQSLPTGDIGDTLLAWTGENWAASTVFEVIAEGLDTKPDDDGCWPVRLTVPGESVDVRVWAVGE